MLRSSCAGLLVMLSSLSVSWAQNKTSVAVMPLSPQRISQEITSILDELLITEVYNRSGMKVIGASDINSMLGFEQMKSAAGCDDVSCAAEIGGALGVDLMLSGTVGRLGEELIITLKLIDISKTELKNRISLRIPGQETAYAKGVADAVQQLFGLAAKEPAESKSEAHVAPKSEPEPETTAAQAMTKPEPEPEPEPQQPPAQSDDDDYLANSIAVGVGFHRLGFEIGEGGWDDGSDPGPSEEFFGALIEYRRKHSTYFTTKFKALLGTRSFLPDNDKVLVEDVGDEFGKDVSNFGAMMGLFEEFTLPIWTGNNRLFGADPTFALLADVGFEFMPPRAAPHMDLFVALGVGGGIRFYWFTLEALAVIPISGGDQQINFTTDPDCENKKVSECTNSPPKNLSTAGVNMTVQASFSLSF